MSLRTPALFAAAAVVLAIGEATDVQSVGGTPAAQLASLTASPGLLPVATSAFVIGAFLLVLATASAWTHEAGRGSRLTRLGLAGLGAGSVWYGWIRAGSDSVATTVAGLPRSAGLAVMQADGSLAQHVLDIAATVAWLLAPIVLWIGLRRAHKAHWLLLVIYLLAAAAELAFAFQSLAAEGVTVLIAVGTVAAMLRPSRTPAPIAVPESVRIA